MLLTATFLAVLSLGRIAAAAEPPSSQEASSTTGEEPSAAPSSREEPVPETSEEPPIPDKVQAEVPPIQEAVPKGEAPARVSIGWDGFKVGSADDQFRLDSHLFVRLGGDVVVDGTSIEIASPSGDERPVALLGVGLVRPLVIFHAWDGLLDLTAQAELAGTPRVLDARLDMFPIQGMQLAAGLLIVPFSRSWNVPLPLVQSFERSMANGAFTPGRRFGTYIHGKPAEGMVELWAGAFQPTNDRLVAQAPLGMVRVQVNPLGYMAPDELPSIYEPAPARLAIGAAVMAQPNANPAGLLEPDIVEVTGTADLGVQVGGFTLYGEAFLRTTSVSATYGWGSSLQAGQFLLPKHLQIVARLSAQDVVQSDDTPPLLRPDVQLVGYVHASNIVLRGGYSALVTVGEEGHDHTATFTGQFRF